MCRSHRSGDGDLHDAKCYETDISVIRNRHIGSGINGNPSPHPRRTLGAAEKFHLPPAHLSIVFG